MFSYIPNSTPNMKLRKKNLRNFHLILNKLLAKLILCIEFVIKFAVIKLINI